MKRIMQSNLIIAVIFAWQLIPVTGFSQECVTCIDSTQNVSIGFLNTFNTAETQQTVLGYNNTTNRNNAVAIGTNSTANWSHSYVFGSFSEANGVQSFVFGSNSIADKTDNFAIGNTAQSLSGNGFAIGNYTKSFAEGAYVLGLGRSASIPLENTVKNSLAIGFKSSIPTFFVGESSDPNGTGNVGIATTDPQAKLHVNGDFQVGDLENPQEIRLHGKIIVTGEDGTAFGNESTASGNYSFVAGRNSHIHSTPDYPGHYSNIIGSWSKIEHGAHANVIGSFSEATNNFSFVLGTWSKTKGSSSFAIGSHVEAWSGGSFIIGNGQDTTKFINVIPNSLMVGFGSTLPTLFVEKAPFSFDNDRTGRIGIGNITAPQAKLHIRADEQEDATLRLEATGNGKHSRIYFTDDHYITAAADDHMHFHTAEDKGFVFHDGDIYLSDVQSGIIMKSPNGQCWRGVMTDAGSLSFSQTTCPEEASFVPEPPVQQGKLKAYPNPTNSNLIIESVLYGNNTEIAISSMEGKLMLRQMITSERTEVSLKSFTPGTYILQLLTNGQVVESSKVVRQ